MVTTTAVWFRYLCDNENTIVEIYSIRNRQRFGYPSVGAGSDGDGKASVNGRTVYTGGWMDSDSAFVCTGIYHHV